MDCSCTLPDEGPRALELLNRQIDAMANAILLIIGNQPEGAFDMAVSRAREKPETRLVVWIKNPEAPEMRKEIEALSHGATDVLAIAINSRKEIADVVYHWEKHLPIRFDIAFSMAEK